MLFLHFELYSLYFVLIVSMPVCQETTAHEVVMLGLREFGSTESSRLVTADIEYQLIAEL